jgi:hypothetical protein
MSGWQRIGVVISVLWLVGLPVYVLIDHNLSGAVPPMTPLVALHSDYDSLA